MESLIYNTENFVKDFLANTESGHNWRHAFRVKNNAMYIANHENIKSDILVIALASLLHDIADSKFHNGDENIGIEIATNYLSNIRIKENQINNILNIISSISYHTCLENKIKLSIEAQIVQDADRLDAIGAIGIARTFNYGGFKSREIYDPKIKPIINISKEEYLKSAIKI